MYDYEEVKVKGRLICQIFEEGNRSETLAICMKKEHALKLVEELNGPDMDALFQMGGDK